MKRYFQIAVILYICSPLQVMSAEVAYIHIFGSVTALPNECYFDALYLEHGVSFKCKTGRVAIGNTSEFKNDFIKYVKQNTKSQSKKCGLKITKFGPHDLHSYLVQKEKQYMLFSTGDEGVFKLAMSVYCNSVKSNNAIKKDG